MRLCENKLDLIRQVLDSSSSAYKKYDKVWNINQGLVKGEEGNSLLPKKILPKKLTVQMSDVLWDNDVSY